MPRRARELEGNVVYHIYNRRTDKQCLFSSDEEYEKFVSLLENANARYPVRLHAYCLMRTHWHFAASAEVPKSLSNYVAWISEKHAVRLRRDTLTVGQGHVYQERFRAVPAYDVVHYARLIAYIEANPLAAGLVSRAEEWRWSSLGDRCAGVQSRIQPGPWRLPSDWLAIVNNPEVQFEMLPSLLGQVASFRPARLAFH
jgi:putative transposase